MKKAFAIIAMLLFASPALAAPDEPVKTIMDTASRLWADNPPQGLDYFDKDHIGLYSKAFVTAYRAAEKFPIYEDGGSPFGYDVITNSQDGCPLQDVTIAPGAETAGVTDVKVTFKLMSCYSDDPGKDAISELHFDVITEDGKPVISDIHRIIEGKPDSLLSEMLDIAKNGN